MSEANSVMTALSELEQIESQRIRAEQARAEDARRDAAAKAARAREAEAHARQVAEAEARLRVDSELAARDADAERRLDAMRRELAAIQEERARLHDRVATSVLAAAAEVQSPRRGVTRGAGILLGAAGLVAGGLALVFALTPPAPVVQTRVIEVPVAAPSVAANEPVAAPAPTEPQLPVAVAQAPASPSPRGNHGRVGHGHPRTETTTTTTSIETSLGGEAGTDPIEGLEEGPARPRSHR